MHFGPDFWIGVAVIPAGLLAVLVIGWLIWASRRTWSHVWSAAHIKLISRIDLQPSPMLLNATGDPEKDSPYAHAADVMRAAVLRTPRLYRITGLGWIVFAVRDYKETTPLATVPARPRTKRPPFMEEIDTDELLGGGS